MASSAARYIQRAPRYVFRPEDRTLMRFAGSEGRGTATRARVRDLSTSGLSMTVASRETPSEGELLKIEFGLPGRKQIAWFANVVRVESQSNWDPELGDRQVTIVGLRFYKLPELFIKSIEKSLNGKVEVDEAEIESSYLTSGQPKLMLMTVATAFALALAFCMMAVPPKFWTAPFHSLF